MEVEAIIWFVCGLVLILSEFFLPGIILVFFGLAAVVVSILTWAGLLSSFTGQLVVFAVLSLVLLFGLRKFFKDWFVGRSEDVVHGEGEIDRDEFRGREVQVVESIAAGGYGKVELKGANWKATSEEDLQEGTLAEVVRREGLTFHVRSRF